MYSLCLLNTIKFFLQSISVSKGGWVRRNPTNLPLSINNNDCLKSVYNLLANKLVVMQKNQTWINWLYDS